MVVAVDGWSRGMRSAWVDGMGWKGLWMCSFVLGASEPYLSEKTSVGDGWIE